MEKFGYSKEQADILRTAHEWYPDEPLFREIPIQVKFNRARVGHLGIGSKISNMSMTNLMTGKKDWLVKHDTPSWWTTMICGAKRRNCMTVVMAGSYS